MRETVNHDSSAGSRRLTVEYPGKPGPNRVLDSVGFTIAAGEILGLLGESGSGKSTAALAVLGLTPPAARIVSGAVRFNGENLLRLSAAERRSRLGGGISYIPQEPLSAMNPTLRVGAQIALTLAHRFPTIDRAERRRLACSALAGMGIADPNRILDSYPFELSGGQLQRALLAQAFALSPQLIVADEPTTALDVTVQAEVIGLLSALVRESGAGVLFVSHNVALVARVCNRTAVMMAGRIMEHGPTRQVIRHPTSSYTRRLLAALPALSPPRTPLPVAEVNT